MVPAWFQSVVYNYRAQFKHKHGRDTTLTDDAVWAVFNEIHDDTSSEACDEARVEEMKEREGT